MDVLQNPPTPPTIDPCLALHTIALTQCSPPNPLAVITPLAVDRSINILVDDFSPQPYQGEATYFFNRLEGDRGTINNAIMDWGKGQVTMTVSKSNYGAGYG